jgi:hypothetical protein
MTYLLNNDKNLCEECIIPFVLSAGEKKEMNANLRIIARIYDKVTLMDNKIASKIFNDIITENRPYNIYRYIFHFIFYLKKKKVWRSIIRLNMII